MVRKGQELLDMLKDGWTLKHSECGYYIESETGSTREVSQHAITWMFSRQYVKKLTTVTTYTLDRSGLL